MPTTNKAGIASKVASLEAIEHEIRDFLRGSTPEAWIEHACGSLDTLLIDHANCEYKAAATGMSLLHKYRSNRDLQRLMARLVREEMLHYEQVVMFMERFGVEDRPLSASRYAQTLRESIRSDEPGRLTDLLVVGAVVEARSCERFASLWPHLPDALGQFYRSLLKSEGRHYQDYLTLALQTVDQATLHARLDVFLALDASLISTPDQTFRFHSGVPVT
jgi:tRNA-(ms[2]io[6]A)-hydroxylase